MGGRGGSSGSNSGKGGFKREVAKGEGYPRGYKAAVNSYMDGYNSGRFGEAQNPHFAEIHGEVNREMANYNNIVRTNTPEKAKELISVSQGKYKAQYESLGRQMNTAENWRDIATQRDIAYGKMRTAEFALDALRRVK